ncbi:MAG: hypothetical protein JXA97_13380 [Anaerolineales bacterium]|nr:hypothetical protein [Anaerolineales bacterium]
MSGNGSKPKLALYWAASCGGCEIAVLGIGDKILKVDEVFDIVLWPVAMDFKLHSIEAMEDKSIDVCLFNGAVRTSEQEYMARLLRAKSKVMVAFGSCAHEGCIPGLANVTNREEIFKSSYDDPTTVDNPGGVRPQQKTEVEEGTLYLPLFYDTVRTLDQVVDVEYYIPGCPPESDRIWEALTAVIEGKLPPVGAVIGEKSTVCDVCPRIRTNKTIKEFKRTWEIEPDPEICLLEQGIICCGIATRAGCGALCPAVGSPCIGCYGPAEGVSDFGARMISALASVIDSDDPEEIDRIIQKGIPDPVGQFYRFGLAHSHLRRRAMPSLNGKNPVEEEVQA